MSEQVTQPITPVPVARPKVLVRYSTQGGLAVLLVAIVILFVLVIGERFTGRENLRSMALQLPELGILSLAMMVTLLHGGVNLAIVSTANLCALTTAYFLTTMLPGAEGLVWWAWLVVAILAGFAVAIAIGLLNGFVIAYFGVSPILTTLGTMIMVKGIAIGLTRGTIISGFPAPVLFIGNGAVLGIPFSMILFSACAVLVAIMLGKTPFGSSIYLMGSNERATQYSGVNTRRVVLKIYVLSSLLAALAGLVMLARFNSASASYGESYVLVTVLASVLGGVDPYGGFGKVSGLVLSLLILQVVASAFNQLGLSQFLTLAMWGLILIGVSAVAMLRSRWGGQ
jgi:ribose/xylose/arabinose/galactoside ABC-type transport system permease subunit